MKRLTLRDVAQAAGVSTMTVSYALRNHPKISKARRDSIRALAKTMGYRPDPQIQAAMSRVRSKETADRLPVALLNVGRQRETLHEVPYYDAVVTAAAERFNELGYHLEEFCLREKGMSSRRLREIFQNRGIIGIFFRLTSILIWRLNLPGRTFSRSHRRCMHRTQRSTGWPLIIAVTSSSLWKHFGTKAIGGLAWPVRGRCTSCWASNMLPGIEAFT